MNDTFSILTLACLLAVTPASAQVGNAPNLINPNLATAAALEQLPQVTPAVAQAIIDGRPYLTAQALDETLAPMLGEGERQTLYARLFRPINLNTASKAEIMLIPGMSNRMVHEFEEYRPYRSMEQFRREIGKYVDDEELARLEQYVFVPMNLNDASEDDFNTIPGMTPRMLHEFEEYRPYQSMEQFRREMAKYVDANEVDRLASYVTLD